MREAHFIDKNKSKWLNIENNLKNKSKIHPDILSNNYIEITNDLAYAQTYYPQSKTKAYLNELALFAHQSLYKDKKIDQNQLIDFFLYKVPKSVYTNRKMLLISFIVFSFFILIGLISSIYDVNFVRQILGNEYVNMSLENIKKGDPAAVYKGGNELGSFLGITINNILVAFYAFAFGIFFSIGTGYILMQNGIMLGAFHYMFYQEGVLGKAMSGIWIHGTIEISVIIIAGGCGLMLGNSFMFPGTLKRIEQLKIKTKEAITILLSTIPLFITAGFLEGFVSRLYDVNIIISSGIILISLFIMVFYYIVFPYSQAKKYKWKIKN
ncbi:stage II sporulation protein M [Faecalibacter sp. WQ 117]|uniref:Stage II sporulation protein M n=1 Tax=Faecalibacter rhinopitheci TaxID=2779678 RepID=A0A8J7FSY1_9FLAO|nr:stage II sporulation protein M [Faecalibacter rhinopitheci]MBQ0146933.1 stage II sporulation protein M [Candidatus Onthonaster equi]